MNVDAGPFSLGPVDKSGPAVLLLHGLSGTPYEVRGLGEVLATHGFACLGPLLPGHGSSVEALSAIPASQWVETALAAYDRLSAAHERVYVAGLSMGGVLTLRLCARRPVPGALLMAPALDLGPIRWLVPLVARLLTAVPRTPDIRDPEARARHPGTPGMPLAAVHELVRLGREVSQELDRIRAPLRLIFSRRDRVVPISNAARILAGVGSNEKDVHYLEGSGHVMGVDLERDRVEALGLEFFGALEERARAIDGSD